VGEFHESNLGIRFANGPRVSLSDAELESIQIRLDAATVTWPPSPAAIRDLLDLARQDLPALLAEVRDLRQLKRQTTTQRA
jgi:hypothetical protein